MKTNTLQTTLRLMMIKEPQEIENKWTKDGKEYSRIRESLEAYLLGTGVPLTLIDLNINKFQNGKHYRDVKLTDLFKSFIKNENDLKTGRKVLLAHVELIPVKNNFAENESINRFEPYLTGYDIADATLVDTQEVESIRQFVG